MDKLRYVQVEPRVIHEDECVGLPSHDVLLATLYALQDGACMKQHGNETHVSQVAVVLHKGAPLCRHEVAAIVAELRLRVLCLE